MVYSDGYSYRFNTEIDNYELVAVTKGTMLIETRLANNPQSYGRYRFILAHELAHWILHQRLYVGTNVAAATYRTDKHNDCSVEWQANYLGKAILMPIGQLKRAFHRERAEKSTETERITALAKTFEVSKQAIKIRLDELGLKY